MVRDCRASGHEQFVLGPYPMKTLEINLPAGRNTPMWSACGNVSKTYYFAERSVSNGLEVKDGICQQQSPGRHYRLLLLEFRFLVTGNRAPGALERSQERNRNWGKQRDGREKSVHKNLSRSESNPAEINSRGKLIELAS